MDLALNNLQRLICHKTQQNKTNKQTFQLEVALYQAIFLSLSQRQAETNSYK